jgi:hypothetical protein
VWRWTGLVPDPFLGRQRCGLLSEAVRVQPAPGRGAEPHLPRLMIHAVMDAVAADRLESTSGASRSSAHTKGVQVAVGARAVTHHLVTTGVTVDAPTA